MVSQATRTRVHLGLALAVGLEVGFAAGQLDAPPAAPTSSLDAVASTPTAHGEESLRAMSTPASTAALPEGIRELVGLGEGSEAAVRAALRFSDDPDALVASVVDGMTRGELELALVTLTGCTRGELEAVRDLHRYAKSYASIAMSGILTDAPVDAGPNEIEFAARFADTFESGPPRTVFDSSNSRLFGVFELDSGLEGDLVAKWYRVDEPELLMFEQVPVLSRDGEAFVRFDRPEGWPEGDYRLEVYAPGEEFELIAAGDYETRGTAGPRRVSFQ
jgi:hypothetical protein